MMMNYYSIERSMEIAKERGESYQDFDQSDYANGKYFEFYTSQEFEPQFEKVRQLFDGLDIPTSEDWKALQRSRTIWSLSCLPFSYCTYSKYFICAKCNKLCNAYCRSN